MKVFCCDCKWKQWFNDVYCEPGNMFEQTDSPLRPAYIGKEKQILDWSNKNNNCALFKLKWWKSWIRKVK